MKIYISIPISGRDLEQVKSELRLVVSALRRHGHTPVSPLEVSPEPSVPYAVHMGLDITALLESEAVYFCKDWQNSKGCLAEFAVAQIYGKTLYFQ